MKYQDKNDPKALSIFTLFYSSETVRAGTRIYFKTELTLRQLASIAWLFYDAPMPPQGIFDDFLAMPSVQKNVSSRSFYDLVMSMNAANPASNVSIRLVIPVFDSDRK
jgi:hypothetical protein